MKICEIVTEMATPQYIHRRRKYDLEILFCINNSIETTKKLIEMQKVK